MNVAVNQSKRKTQQPDPKAEAGDTKRPKVDSDILMETEQPKQACATSNSLPEEELDRFNDELTSAVNFAASATVEAQKAFALQVFLLQFLLAISQTSLKDKYISSPNLESVKQIITRFNQGKRNELMHAISKADLFFTENRGVRPTWELFLNEPRLLRCEITRLLLQSTHL